MKTGIYPRINRRDRSQQSWPHVCGLIIVCLLLHPAPVTAQLTARDSLRVLEIARKAQRTFEVYRRNHLPRRQPGVESPCQEQIGRLCYWHNESDSIVPEPQEVTAARIKLLKTLERANALSRGDDWISGQRVRYLVEGGYDSAAVVASRECWSAKWWCGVLNGFALHASERYGEAEAVFDSALAAMPREKRCMWTDISLLLADDERKAYQQMPCQSEARDAYERHFWQLADPAYTIPGNDRRTEHFSRVLLAVLSESSQNTYGMSWGNDLREVLIRYGQPVTYSTTWTLWSNMESPLIGHEREPSYHFAALDPQSDSTHWDIRNAQARERYAPPYLDKLTDLDAQFAMFKRGDSALVVAIYADTSTRDDATLGILDSGKVTVAQDTSSGARIRIARTAWKGVVVGVEQYNSHTRQGQRARAWVAPPPTVPDAPQLSTMLLYAGDDTTQVASLKEAMHRALTTTTLTGTRRLGVYWETYGAPPDSNTDVSLTVTHIGGTSFFQKLAQALQISRKESSLAVAWHEVPGADGISYRSVVLDLSQLPEGTYRVALSVGTDEQHKTLTTRDIRLR